MAGGILGTGVSGLAAAQYGLDTTGHNIANVNTEGYSRQRVETVSTVGNAFRSTFLGNGTQLSAIERTFNEYNFKEVMFNSSQFEYNNTNYVNASRIDNLLADPDTGITVTFEEMFDGINGIVEEPTIISARNVLIGRSETVANRFNTLFEEVGLQHLGAINEEIQTSVLEINSMTEEIAFLNTKIQVENAVGSQGFPPNDLLDKRDLLLKRLSEKIQVKTIELQDGTMNVTVGQGITLVTGGISIPLSAERNEFDSNMMEIGISANSTTENKSIITNQLDGGSLTGLFDTRDNMILPAIQELGKLAIAIADSFNRQQSLGLDLNGDAGQNIFRDINDPQDVLARTLNSSNNTNKTNFELYIRNTEQLTSQEFDMEYDGTNLDIYDDAGNLVQQFDPADIAAMSAGTQLIIGDTGLAMAIDVNQLSAGDEFRLRPTYYGANQIESIIDDPEKIAAAGNPLDIAEVNNPNNVKFNLYEITGNSSVAPGPLPDDSISIEIDATGTTYQVLDSGGAVISGPSAIPADQIIDDPITGIRFELEGVLAGSEVFTVTHADNPGVNETKAFGPGNNENILAMLAFQSDRRMDGGTNSFSEAYADLVTSVGVETKSRAISADSFGTLLSGAEQRLAGIQGVNLDEEAANLIQYQQSYAAAARIITVARETFQTLLSAAG
ncbi:flagellar hook-associated protein FlgK [Psychrosphaera sp. F3M07]|uniref:flagellar hook-associated protein FlgK n=2 Tax=Psychrosphaera TaxID=907197 RepID=UPI001C09BC6A|nr:flagellar hook-associated protein FlgK [Psychrosphaera sp. F3M07]MBU2917471.1 flagellar hook-associated protein FlgK [Psychrosphaera sp. F3M07]